MGFVSQSTGYTYPFDAHGLKYTSFTIPFPGPSASYALVEGVNYIAVETHAWVPWAWVMAFDLQITGTKT